MMDYIHLSATTPHGESCAQVGTNGYMRNAKMEARTYIEQLVRTFGQNPEGSYFSIVYCPHDFGTYLDIEFFFDDENQRQVIYMSDVESGCEKWDRISIAMLTKGEYNFANESEPFCNCSEDIASEELEDDTFYNNGPTGHGDECLSDADTGL
jgi:hypothetical protein